MPNRSFSRFIPLLVTIVLLAALGVVYGPGLIQAWKFRRTCNAMLAEVRAGNLRALSAYVSPEQQFFMRVLVSMPLAHTYTEEIKTLKLSNYWREDDHIWATVTSRVEGGIGQGKLRWEWDGKEWKLDALGSYLRPGVSDENPWRGLPDLVGKGQEPKAGVEGGLEGFLP